MKKGKTCKIKGFYTLKSHYGTIDSLELKSIYLNIQTWVEPKENFEHWERIFSTMTRNIKHLVYESLDKEIFKDNFIVDLDLRTSGLQIKKKSFMNLEINLYLKNHIDFKSLTLKKSVKKIVKEIYVNLFKKNKYFKFFITKNGNKISLKKEIETI